MNDDQYPVSILRDLVRDAVDAIAWAAEYCDDNLIHLPDDEPYDGEDKPRELSGWQGFPEIKAKLDEAIELLRSPWSEVPMEMLSEERALIEADEDKHDAMGY